jgi:hypothetical protein
MGKWLGRNYAHHCPYITHSPNPSLAHLQHSLLNKPIPLQSLSSSDILYFCLHTVVASPVSTLESPVSTLVSPVSTLVSPVSTLVSPVSTLVSPVSTLVSPVSTLVQSGVNVDRERRCALSPPSPYPRQPRDQPSPPPQLSPPLG